MVRMMNRSEADEIQLSEFTQMQERVTGKLLNLLGKKRDFSGSIASSNLLLDTRRTYKRFKSSSERLTTSKENERKKHPVQLSGDSIMRAPF